MLDLKKLNKLYEMWANPNEVFDPAQFGEVMRALPNLLEALKLGDSQAEAVEHMAAQWATAGHITPEGIDGALAALIKYRKQRTQK